MSHSTLSRSRLLLSKVPEVTLWFWIIKVLCTTVGESAADFLNVNLNFGLTGTSVSTGVLLVVVLVWQFRAQGYRPARYWSAVALVSVFGTLVTDNMTDALGVPLEASTILFSVLLAIAFTVWHRSEGTLSIHSIVTLRREAFYWTAILVTFALGTATGDLMSEVLGLGYVATGLIVAAIIVLTALAWRIGLDPVLSFWIIYVLTRPLGASIGDYLAQPPGQGGLGLGATLTSAIFLIGIVGIVGYLSVTKADVIRGAAASTATTPTGGRRAGRQTAAVIALILVVSAIGYAVRTAALRSESTDLSVSGADSAAGGGAPVRPVSPLGDLSAFRVITQDTMGLLNSGDQSGATTRIGDLETAWDNAEARLKPKDKTEWTHIDGKIDTVLRELRSTSPQPEHEKTALTDLLAALDPPAPTAARPATAPRYSALGDLSAFQVITQDTMGLLNSGDQSGATTRIGDLETAWDNAEARLKPKDKTEWTHIDGKIDTVLRELRSTSPQPEHEKTALTDLLTALG